MKSVEYSNVQSKHEFHKKHKYFSIFLLNIKVNISH